MQLNSPSPSQITIAGNIKSTDDYLAIRALVNELVAKGATAIEYGLIAAGISVAIIAVVNGLGTSLNAKFSLISTQLK